LKEHRTEHLGPAASRMYSAKAEEFLRAAERSLAAGEWNAAGLGAVHAAISFADAVLVAVAGVRSKENDHGAVAALLDGRVAGFGGASRRQLVGLLRSKNSIEYEHRLVTETEAAQFVDSARRFARWARDLATHDERAARRKGGKSGTAASKTSDTVPEGDA
jgi:HEPN domain-containing protein